MTAPGSLRFLLSLVVCAALCVTDSGVLAAPPKPLQVLVIVGGCCHDYHAQQSLIARGLESRAQIECTIVHQGGSATDSRIKLYEDDNWSQGYDVVIHDECFADVKDPAWTSRVLKPHKAGLPAVVIHCAMHCYRDGTDEWFKFCGVTSRRHGGHYAHEVLNRDAAHPVMQTFGPAWANPAGELYWIEKVWPTATPLASAKNRENGHEEVCVWTNQYGPARVFGTTLGHHNESVADPRFLDLLTRGTLWAAGKLSDEYLIPQQPQRVPVNIAVGKPVKASSEETGKGNLAKNACDGNASTRWCANGANRGEWIEVDLGESQALSGCRIDWENRSAVYRYSVEGSVDGKTWTMLADARDNKNFVDATHEFEKQSARYVKLTFLGGPEGQWGSLWEFSLHGDKFETVSPEAVLRESEKKLLAEVKVPPEFEATLFAAPPAVQYPTFLAAAPNGDVYVSVDKNGSLDRAPYRGAVYKLRDLDHDGRADEVKLFVPDIDSPRGLVWDHDRLYVLHPPHLSAFIDTNDDGIADEQKVLIKNLAFSFQDRPADHTSNGVTLGIDGWLYLAIGDFGFMEAEGADGRKLQLRGGGVVRVRPDGSEMQVYSRGTRNILEIAVDPLLNGFTRDNTNDGGGWDIRLHHFTGLDHHGYPSLFKNFAEEIIQPLADYGGGSGCGVLYLDEPGFPAGFSPALYTADWGQQVVFRHQLTPSGATFTPDQTPFVSVPRVTDLDVDAQGQLFIASWRGATFTYAGEDVGFLVRVVPKGFKFTPAADVTKLTIPALAQEILSSSHRRRLAAQREFIRRKLDKESTKTLTNIVVDKSALLPARVAALFALKQGLGAAGNEKNLNLAWDEAIFPFVLRALSDREQELDSVGETPFITGLNHRNPRTRLEALVGLARLGREAPAVDMVEMLGDEDPVVAHTAIQALVMLNQSDAVFAVVDNKQATPGQRAGALRVLQAQHKPEVVSGLIDRLARENDAARRQGIIMALCRLHFIDGKWTGTSWGTRPDTSGPYYQPETWSESARIAMTLESALKSAAADEVAVLVREMSRHKLSLDRSLEIVLDQAAKDATLIPAAMAQLARVESPPARALPLLLKTAAEGETSASVRANCAVALLRINDPAAFLAGVRLLDGLRMADPKPAELPRVRDAFFSANLLQQRLEELRALSGETGTIHELGLAGLLFVSQAASAPEVRDSATTAVTAYWMESGRRAALLRAALFANHRAFEPQVRQGLSDADPQIQAVSKEIVRAWKLSDKPTPASPRLDTLSIDVAMATVEKEPGDAGRGEQVFLRLSCAKCHTTQEGEALRGPHLPSVAKTYKRNQLIEAILLPNKTLAQGFVTNVFLLKSGRTLSGFVTSEAADVVTIRDAEGKEIRLPVAEIEERAKKDISVMPEGLAKDLTVDDLASLVSYLESLKK